MIDFIINNIEKIAGSILLASFAGYIVRRNRNRRKKRTAQAAVVFRGEILAALEGLYPITTYWKSDVFDRFRESIPKIEAAAAEFRHFIPFNSRNSFDTALKNYREHCKKITWESCATFNISPAKKFTEEAGPKEIFRQNVNALLSFAKRT